MNPVKPPCPVRNRAPEECDISNGTWFYTYVLKSNKDGNLYTGCTNELKQRLEQHNNGLVYSTKHRRPLKLIYFEACLNKDDAYRRERYLKTGMGKRYLKNRLSELKRPDLIKEV